MLATGFEYWDIQHHLEGTKNSDVRAALVVKQVAVASMAVISLFQLIAGISGLLGSAKLIAIAMNPWFAAAALIAGFVYLLATVTLNYLKRDAIGNWLYKSTWSKTPNEKIYDKN
ncbi:hypothetical protein FQ192_11010 [Pseudomonas sp. ANT_J12]|uniref:hypothetical protein n=1 Tax=Pseudomonas sp. ANT_J12 TaxID=2597351 RepID=UPI0011F0F699|nr:hypothetical protein [Pseudomonas sp. ANT_J12]KAA0994671.1 hypothetical protein FQ192_11010 [Pseudomonas sp. ANT_J12]